MKKKMNFQRKKQRGGGKGKREKKSEKINTGKGYHGTFPEKGKRKKKKNGHQSEKTDTRKG
jgi:hypothetical protein